MVGGSWILGVIVSSFVSTMVCCVMDIVYPCLFAMLMAAVVSGERGDEYCVAGSWSTR